MNKIDIAEDFVPGLKIEPNDDGTVTLESEWSGNVDRVTIHPIHVRHLAEQMGLIPQVPSGAGDSALASVAATAELHRDLDRLKRYLLRIRGHGLQLQHNFKTGADWQHADLTFEMGQINTLVDLLDMAVDDFADEFVGTDPEPYKPAECSQQPQPVDTGAKARVPKTGPVPKAAPLPGAASQQLDLEAA